MTLFDALPATNVRPSDPATSHTAAALPRQTLREQVRATLAALPGGATDWELTAALGLPDRRKPSVSRRRDECGAEAVRDANGRPVTRLSPDGCPCTVWVLR